MKKAAKKNKTKEATPEALIERGNHALASLQPELAARFFQRALALMPDDTNIMDALADALLQIGEKEAAFQLLTLSTSTAPEENPYKWYYLAQLQSGKEAVTSYQRGIEILTRLLQSGVVDETTASANRKQVAKAFCSIAELYMTDLCYEDDAERQCESAILHAFEIDGESLDGNLALASLRLSQNRAEEASRIMEVVYTRVKRIKDIMKSRTVIAEISGAPDEVEQTDVPESDFCINTAKYLIECAAVNPAHAEAAIELIGDLLDEDDENIELWYMAGVAALGAAPPDLDAARFHLERAQEMMETLMQQAEEAGQEFPFAEQYGLVQEHLRMLTEQESRGEGVQGTFAGGAAAAAVSMSAKMASAGGGKAGGGGKMDMGEGGEEDEEEEWSSCDEEDNDDDGKGQGGAAVMQSSTDG